MLLSPAQAQYYGPKATNSDLRGVAGDKKSEELRKKVGVDQNLNKVVPLDLNFRDEMGKQVRLGNYFGEKPVMLMMISYACSQLCTAQAEAMLGSLQDLEFSAGKEFNVVIASLDPSETAEMARAARDTFVKKYDRKGAENGVHFLAGDATSTAALAKAAGLRYTRDERTRQWVHPDAIILLTPEGKISQYHLQLRYEPRDLRLGVIKAAQNRIGSPLDYLALQCFHWNPKTGTYSVNVMSVLRLGGMLTVLVLALGIGTAMRREKKKGLRAQHGESEEVVADAGVLEGGAKVGS